MRFVRCLWLAFAVVILAGCAGSREAAVEPMPEEPAPMPHPLAGTWSYTLDTPQGVYSGMLEIEEADGGMLSGMIVADDAPDEPANLDELVFDAETSKLVFRFDAGEFGRMTVDLTLDGDALSGLMKVIDYGFDVPMAGTRRVESEPSGQVEGQR